MRLVPVTYVRMDTTVWGIVLAFGLVVSSGFCDDPVVPLQGGELAAPLSPNDVKATPSADAVHFFETKIRPILANSCYECHGPGKSSGELRLDSLEKIIHGGESGPAVVPGKPDESLLVNAVKYESLEMPPTGKLDDDKISLLSEWVRMGAPWPGASAASVTPKSHHAPITDEERNFWAFVPPRPVPPPTIEDLDSTRNPIDSFIRAKLKETGIQPSSAASPRDLIRRAYFDLIGLPPDRAEVDAFLTDDRPDAYERLLDQLLASPHYGERWGRHWLDVVRFAQTNGYERDAEKPFAWRYRDYVINSLNADKPYDQFIREQIAGDELDVVTDETIIATGFARLGVWDDEPDDKANATFECLDDMVSTTGSTVLGLTVGCARCHDHKFDPIRQQDYYGLVAFFRNVREYEKHEGNKTDFSMLAKLSTNEEALAIRESGTVAPPTNILIRGDARTPGAEVKPQFLEVLCQSGGYAPEIPPPKEGAQSAGRRRVLADWLASQNNPLTARVIVNRLWQHHFGMGIVPTPSDFGKTGSKPSHLELLDWLALDLVNDDWRLKRLHRLMMESATYRQGSKAENPKGNEIDPENRLVWRQTMRRLDAESMHDTVLAADGRLNLEMGGRGYFPELPKELLATQSIPGNGWGKSIESQQARRGLYTFVKRTLKAPILDTFDSANPDQSIAARSVTTIAPQALLWLNSSFMEDESQSFARRLIRDFPGDRESQIRALFSLAYQRDPSDAEVERSREFLDRQENRWREAGITKKSKDPLDQWERPSGVWHVRKDLALEVELTQEAKAIWADGEIADGLVEAEVMLLSEVGDAGVIVRVSDVHEGLDAFRGYNINIAADKLRIGRHEQNYSQPVFIPMKIEVGKWHHLKIELVKDSVRVYLDYDQQPTAVFVDPNPLPPGKVGFRTFGSQAAIGPIRVVTENGEWITNNATKVEAPTADDYYRLALAGLAKIILNTNEFVYVD
ncbi:PSD1 and planctomycete cytochrome C domain-containing protein [bacterium]|nr:PSD1 and planctomycete cytochrome C domain-containing protein [bacterium]